MRLLWLFLGLTAVVLISFAIWGDGFESQFTVEGSIAWLRSHGNWAWFAAIMLLASDLVLPIPSTVVFTALGILYGPWLGGLIGTVGFALGGFIAYGACRGFGERIAQRLLGDRDYQRGRQLFEKAGGWIVVLSRWLPVLPEVISCIAGLTRMPVAQYSIALICGSAPVAFAFAVLGHAGRDQPMLAVIASMVMAPILWFVAGKIVKRHERAAEN
ncbi:MAG: VTT domain-containing protein [Verrucomicrobiae bacterium]|nr:VTT domain-containing protein [Verrucomicrobiae bacterium]